MPEWDHAMPDYAFCGWRLQSALALPELAPWNGDDRAPDVVVTLNGDDHDYPIDASCLLRCSAGGRLRLAIPKIAKYHVRGGNEVAIAAASGADPADIRIFLFNAVLGLLAHQRGLLPLQASAIRTAEGAIAFVGGAAAGKSTLAAALARRGYDLLSDDVSIFDATSGRSMLRPTLPRVKLWRDALEAMAIPIAGLARNRRTQDKYVWELARPDAAFGAPVEVRRLYVINNASGAPLRPAVTRTEELPARTLLELVASPAAASALGVFSRMLVMAKSMLQPPRLFHLSYRLDYKDVEASIDAVEEALQA